ncbi:MAG: hypothetical protein NC177_01075 [Ruminococcus flavefaciens]|nr:hypothetical protein [Ruminococcus flavefaciens]
MNIESVKTLFTLFSGEDVTEKYLPLITLSVSEVEKMLIPDADPSDVRLDFLCASMANHRLQQINSARERAEFTVAGKMLNTSKNTSLAYSEKLLRDYMNLCADLIRQKTFVFMSFADVAEE